MNWLRRVASALLPGAVAEPLRRLLRRLAVARFRAYDARHVYGGQSFLVHIADPLARGWYDHDWDLGSEIALLQRRGRLQRGARVFDLGAHQGVVALMLAGIVGPAGQVVAVEAVAHNARVARRNAEANGFAQLAVVHAAIGDADGSLWFEDRWNGAVSAQPGVGVRVEAVTIDTLSSRYGAPDVLFVDVEGFELQALRGAAQTLKAHQPDLYVEAHVGAGLERFGSVADLLALIPAGYELCVAPGEAGDFVPIAEGRDLMAERFRLVAFTPRTSEITVHD
ncbi:MAG: FkbM family methyltransferase [Gemmatimonadaceae bacterium]|nr:FkbM family methyltransferase [Gemmatimonadaceae bacterium]